MYGWLLLAGKELREALRDKRTLLVMFGGPIVLPLLVILLLAFLGGITDPQTDYRLIVVNAELVPELVDQLSNSTCSSDFDDPCWSLTLVNATEENHSVAQMLNGSVEVVLVISPGFNRSFTNQTHNFTILYDSSRLFSLQARQLLQRHIEDIWEPDVVNTRLTDAGLEPNLDEVVLLESQNVAPPEERLNFVIIFLPVMVVDWVVFGVITTAIDITAGEKERRTLEWLLTSPLSRPALVAGKIGALMGLTAINIGLVLVLWVGGAAFLGLLSFAVLDFLSILIIIANLVLVSIFINSMLVAIGIFSKSVKEASQWMAPIIFALTIPAIVIPIIFLVGEPMPVGIFLIPVMNAIFLFQELFTGTVDWLHIGLSLISTAVGAVFFVAFTGWLYGREGVLFRT